MGREPEGKLRPAAAERTAAEAAGVLAQTKAEVPRYRLRNGNFPRNIEVVAAADDEAGSGVDAVDLPREVEHELVGVVRVDLGEHGPGHVAHGDQNKYGIEQPEITNILYNDICPQ